jgi:hypothetical protein
MRATSLTARLLSPAQSVMKDIEDDYLKTIDRQAELDVQMATLQDLRQRLTQGHQVVRLWPSLPEP